MSVLRLDDERIESYLQRSGCEDFSHHNEVLDRLMLDRSGLVEGTDKTSVQLCHECFNALRKNKIPKFALKNDLYRGQLPVHLQDLTWMEEMTCAIYRNTAHVTKIYEKAREGVNPLTCVGNVCAHDLNVVSTASKLPRTPADIKGHLSIVWVGRGVVRRKALKTLFKIRKAKVWAFLCWLRENNELYKHMDYSQDALDQYPEDDVFPGIEDLVIH
ncbi:hypothetical protein SISNIDRAFT_420793, partial [Sistotremastrum niveocremeum HHB9708]